MRINSQRGMLKLINNQICKTACSILRRDELVWQGLVIVPELKTKQHQSQRLIEVSSKLQSLMRTLDDTFQQVAFGMGYKPEDLLPIDRNVIEQESLAFTRSMAPREKEFYLNKKVTALMQRQNRILSEVEKELKRKQAKYTGKLQVLQPAAVQREIEQHRRMVERNQKYIDTLQRKQRIDQLEIKRKLSSSKHSRSQPSAQSQRSQRSQRSIASNASNRSDSSQRLLLVRQKQKEQENLRRQILQQRQLELSKKSLKAEEELNRKSQRVKVRGEITTQIVRDNRRELDQLQRGEMRQHLERLKFKIQKTENIRNKQKEQRQAARTTIDLPRNSRPIPATAARYDEKERNASLRMSNQQVMKDGAREYNRMTQQIRTLQVRQNRQAKEKEQKLLLHGLLQHEQERMLTAEQKRNYLRDAARVKQIQREIRNQMTRKNHQSLQQRRSLEKQQIQQRLVQKFEEIDQIGGLRKQLGEQRRKISRVMARERQSLQTSFQPEEVDSFFQPA